MRPAELTRRFGVRVAAVMTIMILGSMIILGASVYTLIDDVLENTVAGRVEQEVASLIKILDAQDADALISEITKRTSASAIRRFVYHLEDSSGHRLAGDAWVRADKRGWSKQSTPADVDSTVTGAQALVLTRTLGTNLIVSVGRDIRWVGEVERGLLRLLQWAMVAGLGLAILTAYLTIRLVAHRVELIVASARAIMQGDLTQRVPLARSADDFDHLAETLNEMFDRIQSLIGDVEQVTNDIAHDLRTPLGRLRQGLELARTHANTSEEYALAVDRAIAQADGLQSTFTAMLRIAQAEAGGRRSHFRSVDLSEVMRCVVDAYELSAEESGHRLVASIPDACVIRGDRDLLVQAFANLVENALTHTPAGSIVTLSLERAPKTFVATISDNGPGVPAAERDKIFQRFYRLEQSRTTPGTGLGLSLVAAVVKQHGAKIAVSDSRPGLRVDLTFPLG